MFNNKLWRKSIKAASWPAGEVRAESIKVQAEDVLAPGMKVVAENVLSKKYKGHGRKCVNQRYKGADQAPRLLLTQNHYAPRTYPYTFAGGQNVQGQKYKGADF